MLSSRHGTRRGYEAALRHYVEHKAWNMERLCHYVEHKARLKEYRSLTRTVEQSANQLSNWGR